MRIKIPIDTARRNALILSMAAGVLTLDALPEARTMLPKLAAWSEFWRGIAGTDDGDTVGIPLNREGKIIILQSLQRGYFYLSDFGAIIEAEAQKEPFLDLMQAATAAGSDGMGLGC